MKPRTIVRVAGLYCLSAVDSLRVKFGKLPKDKDGAAAMGRRWGVFLKKGNPYLPNVRSRDLSYSTVLVYDQPIHVRAYDKTFKSSYRVGPLAEAFQLAKNDAIWKYHMKRNRETIQ